MSRYEQVGLPEIAWGETLCWRHCGELAVLAFDGYPYCLDHGEDAWEREVAREIDPATAELLLEAQA